MPSPALAAVGCHTRLFPSQRLGPGMRAYARWLRSIDSPARVREEAFVECPVAHPTLMLRSEWLRELGYRDRGWPEDYDLVLRLLERGAQIGVVARRLLSWRQAPGRLSRSDARYTQARFTACKADFLARGFLAGGERYGLWGYGGTGRALARALRGHGKQPRVIVELHPRRIGKTIQGARVISPGELDRELGLPLVVSVAGATARGADPGRAREARLPRDARLRLRGLNRLRHPEACRDILCAVPDTGMRGGPRAVVGLDRGGGAAALLGALRPDRFLPGVPRRRGADGRRGRAHRPRASDLGPVAALRRALAGAAGDGAGAPQAPAARGRSRGSTTRWSARSR